MNKYLKSAAERFAKLTNKEVKINPISELDGEILTEIYEALKKISAPHRLIEILAKYKFLKDEQVRDYLLEFNTNFIHESKDEEFFDEFEEGGKKKSYSTEFISIKGKRFVLRFLFAFEPIDDYNNELYYIKLNPTPQEATKVPLYSNELIEFNDDEQRDEMLENLDNLIREAGGKVRYLNDYFE